MIGRLIQQQDIRLADQRPGQHGTTAPSPGQRLYRNVAFQTKTRQDRLDFLLDLPAAGLFEFVLQIRQAKHVLLPV